MNNAGAAILTLAVGALGGAVFYAISFPAAFLTGSAAAVTLYAAALKQRAVFPQPVRHATFAVLGAMMGAGITPEALSELVTLPFALLGLVAVIVGAMAASYVVLRKVGGWDRLTALTGSIPGHFSLVMIVAMENGAILEKVVMAQAFRLVVLVTLVPFVLGGADAATLRTVGPADATFTDVVITLVIALVSMGAAIAVRLPAPSLMGPMIVATVLSGTGLVTIAVPAWLAAVAFVFLGVSVGARFTGVKRAGMGRILLASAASFVVAVGVAIAVSVVVAALLDLPLGAVFLAYAPGGLDAMIALTFLLGLDVAFVAVLHTARMLILGISIPLLVPAVRRRLAPADGAGEPPHRAAG